MKTSLQNTLEDIKSKEDKDSDIPASRRTQLISLRRTSPISLRTNTVDGTLVEKE